ncbi:hypothetical protein FACS1894137_17120 [Spirochaetia bacterium]|nr:hypothetical protein FACS1894137_17120 [Spirochaetia bacterium]
MKLKTILHDTLERLGLLESVKDTFRKAGFYPIDHRKIAEPILNGLSGLEVGGLNNGSSHEMVEFKRKECKIGVWKKKMYMGSMTGCWE